MASADILGGQVDLVIVAGDAFGHYTLWRLSKSYPAHVSFDPEQAFEEP